MKQRGFVLAEFVIALPLLILLLFALGQMTYKIFSIAKTQAADYVLENEVQDILKRITDDAKSAYSVEIREAISDNKKTKEIQEIFFNYYIVGGNSTHDIPFIIYTHRYTVGQPANGGARVYAERKKDDQKVNPISGGNFFGDTAVRKLKFTQPKKNILHIELEMQSLVTEKKFKVATSVFMSACKE